MIKKTLTIDKRIITILTPALCAEYPIIYTHLNSEAAEATVSLLGDMKAVLVAFHQVDWNGELSPWPAPRAFRGEVDFAGGADTYLSELIHQFVPTIEASIGYTPDCRVIVGYSMAGLFAVYALYHTNLFCRAASVSGSLWYDDFLKFMKENRPMKLPERVYFSLGDRESQVRNQRLARVEDCTIEAEKLMSCLGSRTIFELNQGNHFADVPERIAKGIRWVLE